MNEFGIEIQEVPIIIAPKKVEKEIIRYPKIKPTKVMEYIEKELPRLDLLWFEEHKESENNVDSYEESRYLEGHIQAIFDFLEYFGYDTMEFVDLIPNLNKYTIDTYQGKVAE